MTDFNLASWYVFALTGNTEAVIDWRLIHDTNKEVPAHNYRGTLRDMWSTLCSYNSRGYGVFASINALRPDLDPTAKRTLEMVDHIRTHVVDLDSVTAPADYERAVAAGASFAVQSSANKFHVYFKVHPYQGNEFFELQQRKLNQLYNGDPSVIDATRVMRVAGFYHLKGEPQLVNLWTLPSFERLRTHDEIAAELAPINVVQHFGSRKPLGTPELAAPSLDWLIFALKSQDPNDMSREEWLSLSAAFKQSGWNFATDDELFKLWSEWCDQYEHNDAGENRKLWDSIRDTETGWKTFERRTHVSAYMSFGYQTPPTPQQLTPPVPTPPVVQGEILPPTQTPRVGRDTITSEIISPDECSQWFDDCYFVEQSGKIVNRSGRFMNSTQFNGVYGGKQFIITSTGKLTDEPWKAALRSTCWTIPKVDHIRFLPDHPTFDVVYDGLGRRGLNVYIPARVNSVEGDISPFFDWLSRILPDRNDQRILIEYLAHCVKYKGFKIPWSPMLQSVEGIGKTIFRELMANALGDMYVYSPKAPELVKSGSTFNAWMRNKLMIVVDEIKIDERRELIEILKPMITDARVEIQSKGVDQDMEDNAANWLFFSNYKDAIPINKNGRRYAIFFSAMQSNADLIAAGMDKAYFQSLWRWLREGGGFAAITHYLQNYPIERGGVDVRAPDTSSRNEALAISRSPLELIIAEAVADNLSGFSGGYVSTVAAIARAKASGIRSPNTRTVQACLEAMGFAHLGRSERPYFQEDATQRSEIYAVRSDLPISGYARAQGYE